MGDLFRVLLLVHDEGKTKTQCCESIDGSRPCEVLITWFRFSIINIHQTKSKYNNLFSILLKLEPKLKNAVGPKWQCENEGWCATWTCRPWCCPPPPSPRWPTPRPSPSPSPRLTLSRGLSCSTTTTTNKVGGLVNNMDGDQNVVLYGDEGIKWFSSLWSTLRKYFPVVVVKGLWNGWKEIKMPKKFQRISLLDSKNLNIGKLPVYKNWDKKLVGNQNLKGWLQERRLDQNSNFRSLLYASYTPHASYTHSKSKNLISLKKQFRERLFFSTSSQTWPISSCTLDISPSFGDLLFSRPISFLIPTYTSLYSQLSSLSSSLPYPCISVLGYLVSAVDPP